MVITASITFQSISFFLKQKHFYSNSYWEANYQNKRNIKEYWVKYLCVPSKQIQPESKLKFDVSA